MNKVQVWTDKMAIGLSALCAFHCLLLPFVLVLFPALVGLPLTGESFHLSLLFIVIPSSAIALYLGCKKHNRKNMLMVGGLGLAFMVLAVLLGHDIGEWFEKSFTLIGATLVAIAHFMNYKLCKNEENCHCPSHG